MVRINLIIPNKLADQHLIAEYNEILMLLGYVRKYPKRENIPKEYCLGKGHIKFFKDKLVYLNKRHNSLKQEMIKRNFHPEKTIKLSEFPKNLKNDWKATKKDILLIKKRLQDKIKVKNKYYKYYGENKNKKFFLDLLK